MKAYVSILNAAQLEADFRHFYREVNEDQVLPVVLDLLKSVRGNAYLFLRAICSQSEEVQKSCRLAAVAQMFRAKVDYRRGYPYVDTCAHSTSVMLRFQDSTAMVSKYGEVLVDEGEFYFNPRTNYCGGWAVSKTVDGVRKYGFLTTAGVRLLPCVFDDYSGNLEGNNFIYNGGIFRLRLLGDLRTMKDEDLGKFLNDLGIYLKNSLVGLGEGRELFVLSKGSMVDPYRPGNPSELWPLLAHLTL